MRIPLFLFAILVVLPSVVRAADLCNNTNGDGVQNMTSLRDMACTFASVAHVTQIVTYHWNNGRGKIPGTLGLKDNATGKTYGPFFATGSAGQGGAPNVNWVANVNLCLPPGTYSVLDSDWTTWSMNAKSAYRGFVIVRGDYGNCSSSSTPKPPATTNPPRPLPPPINLPPASSKVKIDCFLNSGTVPTWTTCKGPANTVLGVYLPMPPNMQRPYDTMVFKSYGFPEQTAKLEGSGYIHYARAPQSLCVNPAPNIQKASGMKGISKTGAPSKSQWEVYVTGPGRSMGPIGGGFSITGCGGKLPKVLPVAQACPANAFPPTATSIAPCYKNSQAIAAVGPCFGPVGSPLAVHIYNKKRGPFSMLVFKTDLTPDGPARTPALVTAPLCGTGDVLLASAPSQLCLAKWPHNKWQVSLDGPTKSLGQIGDFSITGCSGGGGGASPGPSNPGPSAPKPPLIGNIRVIPGGGNHPECAAAGNSLLTVNVQGSNFDAGAHIIVSFIYFVAHNKFRTDFHGRDSRVAATMMEQTPTFLSGTISLPAIHQTGGDPFGIGGNYYVQVQNGDGQVNPLSPNYFTVPPYNGADSRCR